jgi:hypothetical protein
MIVDLNECRRQKKELQDDYDRLVRWRASLEEAVPVANRHLDEIDKMLSEHPLLEPNMEMAIKSRAIYVLWLEYGEADALRKREILLSLRKIYRALPEHYQIEFCELWWRWLDDFEEEEIANGTRADSSRKYVWTPAARQLLRS